MDDDEKTPILQKDSETPTMATISEYPVPETVAESGADEAPPGDDNPDVTSPRLVDSVVIESEPGYCSRESLQWVFMVLSLLHGLLNVGVWLSFGITIYYLEGTSMYYWAVIGLAAQMLVPTIQCSSIASGITSIGYNHAARMGLKTLTDLHICFLTFLLLSSLACVGVSVTFGIRYGENGENDVENKENNQAVGILNVALSSVVAVVTAVSIYFTVKLRRYLLMANVNSGPFATDDSYSQ